MEDLADHGQALLATLGTRMQAVEPAGPRFLHADTSAFALFGDYPDTAGLTVDAQGQVVAGTMFRGNTSDRQWHPDWREQWAGEGPEDFWRGSCSIRDAAVVTYAALWPVWTWTGWDACRRPIGWRNS